MSLAAFVREKKSHLADLLMRHVALSGLEALKMDELREMSPFIFLEAFSRFRARNEEALRERDPALLEKLLGKPVRDACMADPRLRDVLTRYVTCFEECADQREREISRAKEEREDG